MRKIVSLVLLLLVMCNGFDPIMIDVGRGIHLPELTELLNLPEFTCETDDLQDIATSLETWKEILENKEQIEEDTAQLQQGRDSIVAIQQKALQEQEQEGIRSHLLGLVLLQMNEEQQTDQSKHFSFSYLIEMTDKVSPFQSWRQKGMETLQTSIKMLETTQSPQDTAQCCERLIKIIDDLMKERAELSRQISKTDITVKVITTTTDKINEINNQCSGQPKPSNLDVRVITSAPSTDNKQPQSGELQGYGSAKVPSDNLPGKDGAGTAPRPPGPSPVPITGKDGAGTAPAPAPIPAPIPIPGKDGAGTAPRPPVSAEPVPVDGLARPPTAGGDPIPIPGKDGAGTAPRPPVSAEPVPVDGPTRPPTAGGDPIPIPGKDGAGTAPRPPVSAEPVPVDGPTRPPTAGGDPIPIPGKDGAGTAPRPPISAEPVPVDGPTRPPTAGGDPVPITGQDGAGVRPVQPPQPVKNEDDDHIEIAPAEPAPQILPQGTAKITPDNKVNPADSNGDPVMNVVATDKQLPKNIRDYGYGFWLRFLHTYPSRLWNGKNAPWYFTSRLTINENYQDAEFGDRLLGNWQGQGLYHFTTLNNANKNPNVYQNINTPADIEGLWTFVYFSYGKVAGRAVGFIKYDDAEPQRIQFDVQHPEITLLKFVLGGKQFNYPGVNGIFTKAGLYMGEGSFIDHVTQLNAHLNKNSHPKVEWEVLAAVPFTNNTVNVSSETKQEGEYPEVDFAGKMFPHEYAVSGWFRWDGAYAADWHMVYRLTINSKQYNNDYRVLGDRTLALFANSAKFYHFPTYTYTSMVGEGNANQVRNSEHDGANTGWHFIYYGYSKLQQKAYAFMKYRTGTAFIEHVNVNHYWASKLYFVLNDARYRTFQGQVAMVNVVVGAGAYRTGDDYSKPEEFKFVPGKETLQAPNGPVRVSIPEVATSGIQSAPAVVQEHNLDQLPQKVEEYGFGFWFRFLTTFPTRLFDGKVAPWYFMARLTINKPNEDVKYGDRLLSMFQGQGYYHLNTINEANKNPNVYQNVEYPTDIEGLWTFVYFSHGKTAGRSVAFVKYNDQDPKRVQYDVTHPIINYLKFQVGGKQFTYPGFNGQIVNVLYNIGTGAFVDNLAQLKDVLPVKPGDFNNGIQNVSVSKDAGNYTKTEEYKLIQTDTKLPTEYSVSGWFKWEGEYQDNWHMVFRFTINNKDENADYRRLGDRTLSVFANKADFLHFNTYNYTTMNGNGNANLIQNIQHSGAIMGWHFIYFGYSQAKRQAFVTCEFRAGDEFLTFNKINHYLPDKMYLLLTDARYQPYQGKNALVTVNTGPGAFRTATDAQEYAEPDYFHYKEGQKNFTGPTGPQSVNLGTKILTSSPASDPAFTNELTAETLPANLAEYGFGFWFRFLNEYPTRLVKGKADPWYFMARMSMNTQLGDASFGDRVLALFQGQDFYHFATIDANSKNPNVNFNVPSPKDIEGVWTYVYFSYSKQAKRVVALVKYDTSEVKRQQMDVIHPTLPYMKFYLGGKHMQYPGFNGVFTKFSLNVAEGSFVDSVSYLNKILSAIGTGISTDWRELVTVKLVGNPQPNGPDQGKEEYVAVTTDEQVFPQEYAVSGWFRWEGAYTADWHLLFRFTNNDKSENYDYQRLGDRTLAVWASKNELYQGTTYSYTGMAGQGDANIMSNLEHKGANKAWHLVYFGYSRPQRKAYLYLTFPSTTMNVEYKNINHYLAVKLFLTLRDQRYTNFIGQYALVNANIGPGAYTGNLTHSKDVFNFDVGVQAFYSKGEKVFNPKGDDKIVNSGAEGPKVLEKQFSDGDLIKLKEYGFGFWCRFLTNYPNRLLKGKDQTWYFMARMTQNIPHADLGSGDRTLGLFQGPTFYHFVGQNGDNPSSFVNQPFVGDIEGVWTYIYYSYSFKEKRAVAFTKFGDEKILQVSQNLTQVPPSVLKFIVGGREFTYPGFNGQIVSIVASTAPGVFKSKESEIADMIKVNPQPPTYSEQNATVTNVTEDNYQEKKPEQIIISKSIFAPEYAWSGWFKWTPAAMKPWHTVVRLTNIQEELNQNNKLLGDRTLALFVGTENQVHQFATYNYENVNGQGNPNVHQTIPYKQDLWSWHFVYFGYSRPEQTAFGYIEYATRKEKATFVKLNHHLPATLYLLVAKDKFEGTFIGRINSLQFNSGPGAFTKNFDESPVYLAGVPLKKENPEPVPVDAKKDPEVHDSSATGDLVHDEEVAEIPENLSEYGYGFWLRFLTCHPTRLIQGKNAPWYIVSRLTKNNPGADIGLGDRTLAIWQGQGFYQFATFHKSGQPNLIQNVPFGDIEGVWTFVYFSYSVKEKKAVGIVRYDGQADTKKVVIETEHGPIQYLHFKVGGKQAPYPGFNGQIANPSLKLGAGAFVEDYPKWVAHLQNRIPHPPPDSVKFAQEEIVPGEPVSVAPKDEHVPHVPEISKLQSEYSVSAWLRWEATNEKPWYTVWRHTINEKGVNRNSQLLGDRDLSVFANADSYLFATYNYTDLVGGGNANVAQQLPFFGQQQVWHFVYFGYSREQLLAYAYVKYLEKDQELRFPTIKHFLPSQHIFILGGDNTGLNGFSGKFAFVHLNYGPGAFQTKPFEQVLQVRPVKTKENPEKIYNHERSDSSTSDSDSEEGGESSEEDGSIDLTEESEEEEEQIIDKFNYDEGVTKWQGGKDLQSRDSEEELIPSAYDDSNPVYDKEFTAEETPEIHGLSEYGYGFWFRWSRTGPKNLFVKQPWHSVARLTINKQHTDASKPGDRTLANWVGVGYYHFTTYSTDSNNVFKNINYANKLDGEWNYLYFSYKKFNETGKATGMMWVGQREFLSVQFDVMHQLVSQYIHFQMKKEFKYPMFNGYFHAIKLNLGPGAYKNDKAEFIASFSDVNALPESLLFKQERVTVPLTEDIVDVTRDEEGVEVHNVEDHPGVFEYSVSGWVRWVDPTKTDAWHLLFRLSDVQPDVLANLEHPGDRTLAAWKGNGFYHFATYTIDQENNGNNNVAQNVPYDNYLHLTWTYVYFGYSRLQKKAHVYVKFATREHHLNFQVIHFVPTTFTVLIQKDTWHAGFNGKIRNVVANFGEGAYTENGFGDNEDDDIHFGYGVGDITLFEEWEPEDDEPVHNVASNAAPEGLEKEITDDDDHHINGITEYGYGFWMRFLWNGYTAKLVNKQPWHGLARLTTTPDYARDVAVPAARTLALWIGNGFIQYSTYSIAPGNNNIVQNVDYTQQLDGQWNYVYFCYKLFNEKLGKSNGFIAFNGETVQSVNFGSTGIIHFPINNYLMFAAGSSGSKFKTTPNFNGQLASVKLRLGQGAYLESESRFKEYLNDFPQPSVPDLSAVTEAIVEDQEDSKRDDTEVEPIVYDEEFTGQTEYAVSLWFRWTPIARVPWEVIYSLTYNEPDVRANHVKPGDRVLSLYQYADSSIYFSSYSTGKNNDGFERVYVQCAVPEQDQGAWMFAYYGYSKSHGATYAMLKTKSSDCQKKLSTFHRVPKYFGLYKGRDGIHTPFNGRFAHFYINGGEGSYIEDKHEDLPNYQAGLGDLIPKTGAWDDKATEVLEANHGEVTLTQEFAGDDSPLKLDGHTDYGYGFWAKFRLAHPTRIVDKPAWQSIVRFTINQDHQDVKTVGDRTLANFLGRGFYHFSTYNLNNNAVNVIQNINYENSLEGIWNFIYFSYSAAFQTATGMVKFGDDGRYARVQMAGVRHAPLGKYAQLVVGKEFNYDGFNGQIFGIRFFVGKKYYVQDSQQLSDLLKSTFSVPQDKILQAANLRVVDAPKDVLIDDAPSSEEWPDAYDGVQEYAIYGWFKYQPIPNRPANTVLLRLTNNEGDNFKDQAKVGDRTLAIFVQPRDYLFATYTIGTVDSYQNPNIKKTVSIGGNLGLWTYVWFGYSWAKKTAHGLIKYPDSPYTLMFDEIRHMIPRYLKLYVGGDGLNGGFNGKIGHCGLMAGQGAFLNLEDAKSFSSLPAIDKVNQYPKGLWQEKNANDKLKLAPAAGENPASYDLEFEDDADGATEYGYGLWARWLQTTPTRVVIKAPWHHLVRLTTTTEYDDIAQPGNRCLATFVGRGFYHFATYDTNTQKNNVVQNIDYGDNLEGNWNYIYFSYQGLKTKKAVGFVVFGEFTENNINRVEFQDISHMPMLYARVKVASKEFAYEPFNGMIHSLQIFYGQGYVNDIQGFKDRVLGQGVSKPTLKVPRQGNDIVLREATDMSTEERKDVTALEYEKYAGVETFAVGGWITFRRDYRIQDLVTIFRLTINDKTLLRDAQTAGDRTLTCFLNPNNYLFSTYDYGALDKNEDDENAINKEIPFKNNKGEWTYLYFGYNWRQRKAYAFVRFYDREDSYKYEGVKHFIPNKFWLYLGNDGIYQRFLGVMQNWHLFAGDGSFTMRPTDLIDKWPYNPPQDGKQVLSAELSGQKINSVRIKREEAKSARVSQQTQPSSATIEQNEPSPNSAKVYVPPPPLPQVEPTKPPNPPEVKVDEEAKKPAAEDGKVDLPPGVKPDTPLTVKVPEGKPEPTETVAQPVSEPSPAPETPKESDPNVPVKVTGYPPEPIKADASALGNSGQTAPPQAQSIAPQPEQPKPLSGQFQDASKTGPQSAQYVNGTAPSTPQPLSGQYVKDTASQPLSGQYLNDTTAKEAAPKPLSGQYLNETAGAETVKPQNPLSGQYEAALPPGAVESKETLSGSFEYKAPTKPGPPPPPPSPLSGQYEAPRDVQSAQFQAADAPPASQEPTTLSGQFQAGEPAKDPEAQSTLSAQFGIDEDLIKSQAAAAAAAAAAAKKDAPSVPTSAQFTPPDIPSIPTSAQFQGAPEPPKPSTVTSGQFIPKSLADISP